LFSPNWRIAAIICEKFTANKRTAVGPIKAARVQPTSTPTAQAERLFAALIVAVSGEPAHTPHRHAQYRKGTPLHWDYDTQLPRVR
jgi:hypothetical protein